MTWRNTVRKLSGMIDPHDAQMLYDHARRAAHGIVEIGSYRGQSTITLALGTRAGQDVPVWAVDPHEPYTTSAHHYATGNRGYFMRQVLDAGVDETVRLVNLPSLRAARAWAQDIDLLYIDGLHDYAHVLADLKAWYVYMVPGGVILLHDYDQPGVQQAVAEFCQQAIVTQEPGIRRIAKLRMSADMRFNNWRVECALGS